MSKKIHNANTLRFYAAYLHCKKGNMYQIIRSDIYGLKVSMKQCLDYKEREYYHPFIHECAISRRLANVLMEDYAFDCTCQEDFPNEFFEDYYLVKVWPTSPNHLKPGEEPKRFVTSDIWYTCVRKEVRIPSGYRQNEHTIRHY